LLMYSSSHLSTPPHTHTHMWPWCGPSAEATQ
jgi:hypothetical protein